MNLKLTNQINNYMNAAAGLVALTAQTCKDEADNGVDTVELTCAVNRVEHELSVLRVEFNL